MAESSGFFEAKWDDTIDNGDGTFGNWDRRYLADNFADYFKNFVGNGVFVSPTNQLKVSTSSGMNVQVSPGWAFIKGYWYHNDENKIITIPSNSGSTSRTDTIKARLNLSTRVITVDLYVNNNSVVRNDTYYDMILAQIVVPAYATTIPAANITDKRPDEAVCGFVKGLVEVITTDDLFDQFQAIFDEWFDGVKDQVTGDLAIRLQLEFTQLNSNVDTYYQNTNNNIAAYKTQMQNIVDTYQAAVEQQVDAAEDLVDGYVYNDYITDELTFTFVNNVCEISDSRVTPNSLLDLYFTKETIDEAENCQVNIESGVQKYIITCVKTPSMSLRGRIRVRVNSATPVVPPELDEFATKSWVNANFLNKEEGLYGASDIKTSEYGQFLTVTGGLLNKCEVELTPIQSGNGTPSPTNVRPISGHTQVQVGNVGKNKLPNNAITTTINGITWTVEKDADGNVIGVDANGTATGESNYYFYGFAQELSSLGQIANGMILSGCPSGGGSNSYYMVAGSLSSRYATDSGYSDTLSNVLQDGIRVICRITNGYTANHVKFKPMIRKATDSAEFEPYQGYTHIINLGGTYYGGTLDAATGVLTVTHGFKTFNGSQDEAWNFGEFTTGIFRAYIAISDIKQTSKDSDVANIVCNRFPTDSYSNPTLSSNYITGRAVAAQINIFENIQSTLANWRTWLASNPLQVAYELATPQTIQLTPTQLETLVGQNNVFVPLQRQSLDSLTYREVLAWNDVEKGIANGQDAENITNEFTFSTDCTWDMNWTRIYRYGRLIKGTLRFVTPNTITSDKIIVTIPTKYANKVDSQFLGVLNAAWGGSINGMLGFVSGNNNIKIISNTWVANSNVVATFEYFI